MKSKSFQVSSIGGMLMMLESGVLNDNAIDMVTGKQWKDVRSKQQYPYSYDPYLLWGNYTNECTGAYSDRMMQWDFDKFNRCVKEVFGNQGQYFGDRNPNETERFLQLYFDKPNLKLIYILQGANMASGFPYWYFGYKEE